MTTPTQTANDYALRVDLAMPYDEAIDAATAALKAEGFGVLTEIDIQKTLKTKIDADFRRYVILGACNPHLANRALNRELEIGLMLPCNVIVYETDDGNSAVSIIDPIAMMSVSEGDSLSDVADEARAKLLNVQAALKAK